MMASTFIWPPLDGRDKRPEELTGSELQAWKASGFYPNRFALKIPQGDGPSSTVTGTSTMQSTKPVPTLNDKWIAAQHNFDADKSALKQTLVKQEQVAPTTNKWVAAQVSHNAAQENVKPVKRSWNNAQVAFDLKSSVVLNTDKITTKKEEDKAEAFEQQKPPHLRTSQADRAQTAPFATLPEAGFTASALVQPLAMLQVEQNSTVTQVDSSSDIKYIKKASWGNVQAAYDSRNSLQGSTIKRISIDPAAAWNAPTSQAILDRSEVIRPFCASLPTTGTTTICGVDQAMLHAAQASANTSQYDVIQLVPTILPSSRQNLSVNDENIESKDRGGGLNNSRWADTQATSELRTANSNEPMSEAARHETAAVTKPYQMDIHQISTIPTSLMAKQPNAYAVWGSSIEPDPEKRRYNAAAPPFTPPQAIGVPQDIDLQNFDRGQNIKTAQVNNDIYAPPHPKLRAHYGNEMTSPIVGGMALTAHNLQESTTRAMSENKKDRGSVVSEGSALMKSRWGPTGDAFQQGMASTTSSKTPTQSLRPDAVAFQSTGLTTVQKADALPLSDAKTHEPQLQKRMGPSQNQESHVSINHDVDPWAYQIPSPIVKHGNVAENLRVGLSHALPPHLRSQVAEQERSQGLSNNSEIAAGAQMELISSTVLVNKKPDANEPVRLDSNSAFMPPHQRGKSTPGPEARQSRQPSSHSQQNIRSLHDVENIPPIPEDYMISRHPWNGPNPRSKGLDAAPVASSNVAAWSSFAPAMQKSTILQKPRNVQSQQGLDRRLSDVWEHAAYEEESKSHMRSTPMAIQAAQDFAAKQVLSIPQDRITEIVIGCSQPVNAVKIPTATKVSIPFNPNKYGKPQKVKQDLVSTVDEASTRHPAALFDPTSLNMDAFSQQMENSRSQQSHGNVWQRTGEVQHIEEDPMFGKRAGLQIWTTSGDTHQAAVVNPVSTVVGQAGVDMSQPNPTFQQPASRPILNDASAVNEKWTVAPDTSSFLGKTSPELQEASNVAFFRGNITAGIKLVGIKDKVAFNEIVMADLRTKDDVRQFSNPLTSRCLAVATGERQEIRSNVDTFDEKICDDGIVKEGVRAQQGIDATGEFYDFDGTRLPAPVDWDDRKPIDTSYIAAYVVEWSKNYTNKGKSVDTSKTDFDKGYPIGPKNAFDQIIHEQVLRADPVQGDTVTVPATANEAIAKAKSKKAAQYHDDAETARLLRHRRRELASKAPEIDPYVAKVNMYLRPAVKKDAAGIAAIYNDYIKNSILPEDQKAVKVDIFERCIENCRKHELPFIVAVKGDSPPTKDALGRLPPPGTDVILPQHEIIFGFAYAEIYNFGLGGLYTGRSRCNVVLQLYVDRNHQHQGVGRNLMDRMVHILSPSYGHRNVVPWVKPPAKLGNTYDSTKAERWHSMFFNLPVRDQEDEEYKRVTRFLGRYHIQLQCVLKGAARTSIENGHGTFADLAIFQGTAIPLDSFGPFA